MKNKYYSLDRILSQAPDARYYMMIGQRSNGKTYACLKHCLEEYFEKGSQFAIIRRWREDFKGKRGQSMFAGLVENGVIEDLSEGMFTGVEYYRNAWYFANYDEDGKAKKAPDPFAYAFALTEMEHDKSTSYPNIRNVFFDEFLTKGYYLPDEFIVFCNVLSTIIRDRDDVKVFMCANTVSKYNPYAEDMGLHKFNEMQPGDLDIYQFGESALQVAVEFTDMPAKKKASDVYFAFDKPELDMIKGQGTTWELSLYPTCPVKILPKHIRFVYFIRFNHHIYQCEICRVDNMNFTYIHKKSTDIKDEDKDIIFQQEYDARPNIQRFINKPNSNLHKKIWTYFAFDNVYYQDNSVGDAIEQYLNWCHTNA